MYLLDLAAPGGMTTKTPLHVTDRYISAAVTAGVASLRAGENAMGHRFGTASQVRQPRAGGVRTMLAMLAISAMLAILAMPASAQILPDGPGKAELQKVCGLCHQAERSAAVRLTREGWEGVIADMIARGARGTDQEFAAVLDYLSKHFLGDAPRPLNINRATAIDLESVGGLTRREAAALLKWRQEVGVCKSLDELKKVPGLDYKKIEARKDFLVCFVAGLPAPTEKK